MRTKIFAEYYDSQKDEITILDTADAKDRHIAESPVVYVYTQYQSHFQDTTNTVTQVAVNFLHTDTLLDQEDLDFFFDECLDAEYNTKYYTLSCFCND